AGNLPFWVMGLELAQIRDVTDVIALARFVHVMPIEFAAGELLDARDGFEHGDAVGAAAAHVVDLTAAGIGGEFLDGADNIVAVDVVANLLALLPVNP